MSLIPVLTIVTGISDLLALCTPGDTILTCPMHQHSLQNVPLPLPPPPDQPARNYTWPKRFKDVLPVASAPLAAPPPVPLIRRVTLIVKDTMQTACNRFGICHEYPRCLSYDPDHLVQPEDLANVAVLPQDAALTDDSELQERPPPPWPFKNMSIYRLMNWANSGSNSKSEGEVTHLADEVINSPNFDPADLARFNAHRENKLFDDTETTAKLAGEPWMKDGWKEASVEIELPDGAKNAPPWKFTVPCLHYRPIVEVIKSAFAEVTALQFHLAPFKHFQTITAGAEEHVYDEVYMSDVWLAKHETLQRSPCEPNCKLEHVIAGLMWWSDSTHLANFRTAKAWPLYLYFANLSKYVRACPTSGVCHQVAYFPSLPDSINDFISMFVKGKSCKSSLLTHCRREFMHQVWRLMLDKEFMHAYKQGIVILCVDGVWRRVSPRIFTYSTDYPETAAQSATSPRVRARVFSDNDPTLYTGLDVHHQISKLRKDPIHLLKFVNENTHNPAKKRFIPKLKDHLLSCLLNRDFNGDETKYSETQHDTVKIIQHIYSVQTMRVNFTTYDMRRDQDIINP
ncbi:hypothetical protein B0H10DRAFT_2226861 [Mycena sp. CBHHK59/15]|nr:hypothetical protein B0H10DRAFT_2226861 [Mycena sp. CBHHK59/15]